MRLCPHCIGGHILRNYNEEACVNCGYQERQPSELILVPRTGHGRDRQDYDGIKREWRKPRVLVDHRTREFQSIDNEIIARVKFERWKKDRLTRPEYQGGGRTNEDVLRVLRRGD